MKTVGVVAAVALAQADVSPWLVAWYVLTLVWLLVGTGTVVLLVARVFRRRLRRRELVWSRWMIAGGVVLLVWFVAAGWPPTAAIGGWL